MTIALISEFDEQICVMAHSILAVIKSNVVNILQPTSVMELPRARAFTQHSTELWKIL